MCGAAAEYRTAKGSLHNPRQDIHYSHKHPSQQNRRAGFNERVAISSSSDFMLQAVFPRFAENHPPPPLFFHCSGRFPPSIAARKRDCMKKVAITLRRVNLSPMSSQVKRDRISPPDLFFYLSKCVPNVVLSMRKMVPYLYSMTQ